MPVRNEERHLAEAVRHVLGQDYPGEFELVLAVGPSADRTEQIARDLAAAQPRLTVVANPTGKIPAALNAAIRAARHAVIARMDGHALMPPGYLAAAVAALTETGAADVGGMMAAVGVTTFQQAVAWAMTSRAGVGSAAFHTGGEDGPADSVYLGVYRREAIEHAGGYDEGMLRAEDWELNYRIRKDGGLIWFTPDLRVTYRPRPSVRTLARQYHDYGRWRRVVTRYRPLDHREVRLVPADGRQQPLPQVPQPHWATTRTASRPCACATRALRGRRRPPRRRNIRAARRCPCRTRRRRCRRGLRRQRAVVHSQLPTPTAARRRDA